jgi:hypothetical protein
MGKGVAMPRVLVVADGPTPEVVMNELVEPEHVRSEHSASQLIERVSWGVEDAERAERRLKRRPRRLPSESGTRSYLDIP